MYKKIYVEITNNCNLKCSFCNPINRKKEFMDKKTFAIILNKIKPMTNYLYLHVMGEPLLHPKINEFIDLASKNFKVNITTNGYLIEKIMDNQNIRQLNISLHSFNSTYGKELDTYLSNIFTVCDLLSKKTIINYRLWEVNDNDKIIKKLCERYNFNINNNTNKIAENIYYSIENKFDWPSLSNDFYEEDGTCKGTIDHIGILVDGTVIPCCLDTNGLINLGNVITGNIDNNRLTSIKKGFLDGKKVENLCRHCRFYQKSSPKS